MSKTQDNLRQAFAGESMARNKYHFFAEIAAREGYEQIAGIFRETARNEREHARRFMRLLKDPGQVPGGLELEKWGDTKKNLEMAAAGEHFEWSDLYKRFKQEAEEEGETEAARQFQEILEVEEKHEERYQAVLKKLKEGKIFQEDQEVQWKCRNCGYVHKGTKPPQNCPSCQKPQSWFERRCMNY